MKATPPGTTWASRAPNAVSSCARSGSRPRGAVAKNALEGLEDNEEHRRDEHERREFVKPAIPALAFRVSLGGEGLDEPPAPHVVSREDRDERDLGVQPSRGAAEPTEPEPDAEEDGQHGARRHDAPEEAPLHDLEAVE